MRFRNRKTKGKSGEDRGRNEQYSYKPKKVKDCQQPPEARRESWNDISPIVLRRTHPCRKLYFILLAF